MRASRRDLLRLCGLLLPGLAVAGGGCRAVPAPADLSANGSPARAGGPAPELPEVVGAGGQAPTDGPAPPGAAAVDAVATGPPAPGAGSAPLGVPDRGAAPTTAPAVRTVAVPPTPTPLPPTPVPTATPRARPRQALLTVPYYSQHVGRQNYCLPTAIAMVADRYDRLPRDVSGAAVLAPRFVADVAYRVARERVAALNESAFTALWEEIGTDPLGGLIWNVFAPNGRDLAAGMSPALAYLVLAFAFGLPPTLGTLDECLVALADDVPSILFGSYAPLRRADGQAANVGGYAGDHALVLVGVDDDRVLANDPLPSDKTRFAGERGRGTAAARAVRFDLASVRRMTRGDGDRPRGDCFMVAPRTA